MYKILTLFLLSLVITGCAGKPEDNSDPNINDPFSGFNRTMWDLNYEVLDPYVIKPAAMAYKTVPEPGRKGISNFISNLAEPVYMLSSLFMLRPKESLDHFNRFWMNTFFGLAGFIDIAGRAGIHPEQYDFSDAMGYYGVGNGPFLVLPFIGPTTPRNLAGTLANVHVPPQSELTAEQRMVSYGLQGLQARIDFESQEALLEQSEDTYLFMRNAYLQHQNYKANAGVVEADKVDEDEEALLDEFLEMDE